MSIWKHSDTLEPELLTCFLWGEECRFCRTPLRTTCIPDLWPKADAEYEDRHRSTCEDGYVDDMGLRNYPDSWRLLPDSSPEIEATLSVCPACGWWTANKQVALQARRQIWDHMYRAEGALRSFDHTNIDAQIEEIRAFVRARYESRLQIHPRKFEELVASVFCDLGFEASLTTYSRDGGIDIVLRDPCGRMVGVQAKRYKGRIEVEQLRSFMGAMVLGGFVRGIFVTTSSYQSGVNSLVRKASERNLQIELIEEQKFFQLLGAAQISASGLFDEMYDMLEKNPGPDLHYMNMLHRNSL